MKPAKCHYSGCKKPIAFACTRLYGKGSTFHACADHAPIGPPRLSPAVLAKLAPETAAKLSQRSFYDCRPV